MRPDAVLRTFSQLSSPSREASTDVITDARSFIRLMYSGADVVASSRGALHAYPPQAVTVRRNRHEDVLLAKAALHKNEQLLRVGWLWFSGTIEREGKSIQYCFPGISVPVTPIGMLRKTLMAGADLEATGDATMSELIDDPDVRAELVSRPEFGGGGLKDYFNHESGQYRPVDPRRLPKLPRLMGWADDIARAADLHIAERVTVDQLDPLDRRKEAGICLHVCAGLYLDRPAPEGTRRESLINLANLPNLSSSAFAKIYSDDEPESLAPSSRLVDQLRPISVRQRRIASDLLETDVSVLSGAPGTGKSHLITVAALDAVSRGHSVLVAAASPFAVDVLVDHFAATPGPTPVVFGGSAHGKRLATELATLVSASADSAAPSHVANEHGDLEASTARMLGLEGDARRLDRDPARRIQQAEDLRRAGDLFELEELIDRCESGGIGGWFARRRSGDELRRRLGGASDVRRAFDELTRAQDVATLLASGGLTLSDSFDHLAEVELRAADQRGKQITAQWLGKLSGGHRRALTRISTALTSDRGTRRRMLQAIDSDDLVGAAPLWVGSVRDIDTVLPAVAGMFDLVILDEAAQIDQINAANALVRAKRALICGDPQQIGHVSFLSDEDIRAAASAHNTNPDVLDPRRQSTYDAAANVAPTQFLDEHFRSAPHLIEFSSRQIYQNGLHVASRHPRNEAADHIDVRVVDGKRSSKNVNAVEVEECLRVADEFITKGWTSIGFVSPFRAQADALEEAILAKYRLDEIEHYGLRVGTVHSFQGDERRLMILSWAVDKSEGAGAWRFVNQKNLFNVMVTRARDHIVVVTSTPNPPGLAGEYVRWSEPLEDLIGDVDVADPWVHQVASALEDAGAEVRTGYRTGRYIVDLVVGSGTHAIAVDCSPHHDGPAAHIDRALQLRRTGWHTADAFASRWGNNIGQLAIELTNRIEEHKRDEHDAVGSSGGGGNKVPRRNRFDRSRDSRTGVDPDDDT